MSKKCSVLCCLLRGGEGEVPPDLFVKLVSEISVVQ